MGGPFVDFFAGSGVVPRSAKRAGFRVIANDWEPHAHARSRAAAACNRMPAFAALNSVPLQQHRSAAHPDQLQH